MIAKTIAIILPTEQGRAAVDAPSGRAGDEERRLDDVRKALDIIAKRAGFQEGQIRLPGLRHTYTAARHPDVRPGPSGEPLHGVT